MLKISKLTDYSIVILSELAKHASEPMSAKELSRQLLLAAPTVSKILKILQEKHIVRSTRGATGGYQLAKTAATLSVLEIIIAMEGAPGVTECSIHHGTCQQEDFCALRGNWQLINHKIMRTLKQISLADMNQSLLNHPLIRQELTLTINQI